MRTLYKSLFASQTIVRNIMIGLFVLLLFCIQMAFTTYSKNLTLFERVEKINGTHTQIFVIFDEDLGFPQSVEKYLQESNYVESYYSTYVSNYNETIYIEGYVPNKNDNYVVLEGKPLVDLSTDEVAITSLMRDKMLEQADIDTVLGEDLGVGRVASVIEYPLYSANVYNDLAIDQNSTFGRINAGDFRKYVLFLPNETVQHIVSEGLLLQDENVKTTYRKLFKVRLKNYTAQSEFEFIEELFSKVENAHTDGIDVVALNELAQRDRVNHSLFSLTWALLISCLLISVAIAYFNLNQKSITENLATLTLLSYLGVKLQAVKNAYSISRMKAYLVSIGIWLVINITCHSIFKWANYSGLTLFYDISWTIIARTLLVSIFIQMFLILVINRQLSSMDTKRICVRKTRSWLGYGYLGLKLAISDLHRNLATIRMVVVISTVILSLLTIVGLNQTFVSIFRGKYSFPKFDYMGFITWEEYEQVINTYNVATLIYSTGRDKVLLYDVRHDNLGNTNQRTLYSSVATFLCHGDTFGEDIKYFFPDLIKGNYPTERFNAIVTTRIANELNAQPFDEDYFKKHNIHSQRGYVVFSNPGDYDEYIRASISGIVDSTINDGYEFFMFENLDSFAVEEHKESPILFVLIVLKDKGACNHFNAFIKNNGLDVRSYEASLGVYEASNAKVISVVSGLLFGISVFALLVVLFINQYSNSKIEELNHRDDYRILRRIGIKTATIQNITWFKELILFGLAIIMAPLSFILIKIPCQRWLSHALGLSSFRINSALPLLIPLGSLVSIIMAIFVMVLIESKSRVTGILRSSNNVNYS